MSVIQRQGRVKAGDKVISARLLNGLSDAINKITNNTSAPTQAKTQRTQPFVRFEVVSVDGDFLLAKRFNPDGTKESANTTIAKPYLLRRSITSRDGIDFTYDSDTEREADDSSDTEDQVIVPSYVAGDQIYAFKPTNGTGVTDDSSDPVIWQEMDGSRAWAKVAE